MDMNTKKKYTGVPYKRKEKYIQARDFKTQLTSIEYLFSRNVSE